MGQSIICRGHKVSKFRNQRALWNKPGPSTNVFRQFGYGSLEKFYQSEIYQILEKRYLKRWPHCTLCREPSTKLQFISWHEYTIAGRVHVHIMTLCDRCHAKVNLTDHFRWRNCDEANEMLKTITGQPEKIEAIINRGWARIRYIEDNVQIDGPNKPNKPKTHDERAKARIAKARIAKEKQRADALAKKVNTPRAKLMEQRSLQEAVRLRELANLGIRPKA